MTEMAFIATDDKPVAVGRDDRRRIAAIQIWLLSVAFLVFVMVLVGGATRLTDSGLSITEWKPITGAVPPLSETAWEAELEKYRQIPEYQLINKGMSLEEFKRIYWWEWGHRLLGRLIGLAFFVPFVVFWRRGWLSRRLKWQGLGLLCLGGLQGVVGWYMVASGLTDRVDVSQYRLALHLGLAAVILAALTWVARDAAAPGLNERANRPSDAFARVGQLLAGLVFLQILLGALVAGLDAGLTFATWPLMDGALIPGGLLVMDPWVLNFFENVKTVQFDHRLLAYLIAALALFHAFQGRGEGQAGRRATLLLSLILLQIVFGVWTLLALVPIPLALVHQGLAFALLVASVLHADANRRGLPIFDRPPPRLAA